MNKYICLFFLALAVCNAIPQSAEEREMAEILADEETRNVGYASDDAKMDLRDFFDIPDGDDIRKKATMAQALPTIKSKIQVYYSIDPSQAMKKLAEVGSLLRLAYAGAKPYPCSVTIVKVLSGYQDLVRDSLITSSTFVEVVLNALKYHRIAAIFAAKTKIEKSLKYLKKCSIMASRMATESQGLIDKADALTKLSVDALVAAQTDFVGSTQERARLTKMINDLKAAQAEQNKIKGDLNLLVKEAKKNEERNEALAGEKETWGIVLDVLTPLINMGATAGIAALGDEEMILNADPVPTGIAPPPVFTAPPAPVAKDCSAVGTLPGLKGQAQEARCREANARALRVHYQQQQLANNANLAKTIENLVNMRDTKNSLDKAIYGLDITIKVLGQVKTIFLNAKTFWVGVQKHTESLAGTQEEFEDYAMDPDLYGEFMEALERSGYSWLTVGKICEESARVIKEVDAGVSKDMQNLPTEAEAKELIEKLGAEILKNIKDDDAVAQAEINSQHNKLPLPPMP